MRLAGLDEPAVAPWLPLLDDTERERAARFVFARHRVQFIAAHALARAVLSLLVPTDPAAWRFVADPNGKPAAWLGSRPAPLSFNLSHTEGMVGLAATPRAGHLLGFDVEALARRVSIATAENFFCPEEVAWLAALPPAARSAGFLRLWTLKEAFIKATGKGLTQDLNAFSFAPCPPRIFFSAALDENPDDWRFEQRIIEDEFVAAIGLGRFGGEAAIRWTAVPPEDLTPAGFRD